MAAQTISAWTSVTRNGFNIHTCTAYTDAANEVNYTNKTPDSLRTDKPWTLIVSADAASDGAAVPLMVWGGYKSNFAISGTTARCTTTSGVQLGELVDDIGYAAAVAGLAFNITPGSSGLANIVTLAAVATGLRFNLPVMPWYAFELMADDAVTLLAHTLTFRIIQKCEQINAPLPTVAGVGPDPS